MRGPRLICEDFILTLRSSIHNPIFLSAFLPLNLLSIFRNFVSLAGPFKSFPGKHFARHCAGRRPEHSNPPAGGYARLQKASMAELSLSTGCLYPPIPRGTMYILLERCLGKDFTRKRFFASIYWFY